jgi:hypothetical protein
VTMLKPFADKRLARDAWLAKDAAFAIIHCAT